MRILVSLLLLFTAIQAQAAPEFWPDTEYDPAAPAFEEVLGHAMGERVSSPAEIRDGFDALVETWPERIRLVPYAESWQGRELFYVVIGTPDRLDDLDAIRADIRAIAHPDGHDAEAVEAALERVPGTVWLSYSVHGNEISPADSALMTAWHLLAAIDDPVVDSILAETLVFIDPMQNPDGRARFVHTFESGEGLEPAASRLAAEHDEPWPSGRVNHYLFDLNRDWLAVTQPETRGRIAALLDWYPLAFVDSHEMGGDSTYFFAPEAVPYNPLLAADQRGNLELFGRNNSRWFDRFGFQYFTREVYDAFYPGYGASWPSYYGGIAMTYEQGSPRGLVFRRRDGTTLTYADAVHHNFVASISTAQTVAENREKLWSDFRTYRESAVEMAGDEGPRAWVIPTQTDQGGADRLAGLLATHGLDTRRVDDPVNACGRELAPGSYVVPADQPGYRKARVLLDRRVEMSDEFLSEQERRRAKDLPDEIYDVTAWSLPLMFNIDVVECARAVNVDGMDRVAAGEMPAGEVTGPDASVAWLVPGGSRATAKLMAAALRDDLYVRSNERPFVHDGREYPSGTLIFPASKNPEGLADTLRVIAEATGADVVGVDDGWVTEGPSFGSNRTRSLIKPRVALAWDAPTDSYAPGAVRFVLERQFGYPIVPIRTHTLKNADLNRFDVVILPDSSRYWGGGYDSVLGEAGRDHLADWVADGGVLVTMAGATEWAAHPDVDLLAFRAEVQVREEDAADPEADEEDAEPRVPGTLIESLEEYRELAQPERENPDSVAGVLARAVVDPDHWLAAGVADTVNVLVRGDRVFQPMSRDQGRNVARFAEADELLASGHLWSENREQLAFKPFVVTQRRGRGIVVGFTDDPAVRAYLDGLNMLLVNAVLRAPSYSGKLR
ncbi:MAG: M14 family zinc carboxypeptidase [Candidatus Wenzhouxiangella sp. M2_3B_020]